jgi:hypothetical protein
MGIIRSFRPADLCTTSGKVTYDNQPADVNSAVPEVISGGNLVIHKTK